MTEANQTTPADEGPVERPVRPLPEDARACARHCIEGAWAPNVLQNEEAVRLNAARLLDDAADEIERLNSEVVRLTDRAARWQGLAEAGADLAAIRERGDALAARLGLD